MVTWLGQAHLGWSPFGLTQNQRIWDLNYMCRIPPLCHTPHPIHRSHSHSRRGGDTGGAHQQEPQPPTALHCWNCHPNKEGEPGHMTGEVASGGQGAAGEPLEGRPGWVPCPPLPATQECSTTSLCSHTLLTHFCDNWQWLIHHFRLQLSVFSDTHLNPLTFLQRRNIQSIVSISLSHWSPFLFNAWSSPILVCDAYQGIQSHSPYPWISNKVCYIPTSIISQDAHNIRSNLRIDATWKKAAHLSRNSFSAHY